VNTYLVHVELPLEEPPFALTQAQATLRQMVLHSVPSVHSSATMPKPSMICLRFVPADLSPVLC
jgi:hypothetical protein